MEERRRREASIVSDKDREGHKPLDAASAGRFAQLALACIHREYPNKAGHHILTSDRDARPPRELTPAFYGCYDWHSAVHGHWMLARLARLFPGAPFSAAARQGLGKNLTAHNLSRETEYLQEPARASFERPYGLAWLLALGAELTEWNHPLARQWSQAMQPLERLVIQRLDAWLPKLSHPVRSGDHSQSAFSLALMLDSARASNRREFQNLLQSTARRFYSHDRDGPLVYEPSGEDFLSPCLAEADLMRRVMDAREFAAWLDAFLPSIPRDGSCWLQPVQPLDPSDPKLGHLDGLNLSRAWMLQGMAQGLPPGDPRLPSIQATAEEHLRAGLASVTGDHYEGAHWLGTFAVYLLTRTQEQLHGEP